MYTEKTRARQSPIVVTLCSYPSSWLFSGLLFVIVLLSADGMRQYLQQIQAPQVFYREEEEERCQSPTKWPPPTEATEACFWGYSGLYWGNVTDMKESGGTNMTSFVVVSDGLGKGMVVLGCGRNLRASLWPQRVKWKSVILILTIYFFYLCKFWTLFSHWSHSAYHQVSHSLCRWREQKCGNHRITQYSKPDFHMMITGT